MTRYKIFTIPYEDERFIRHKSEYAHQRRSMGGLMYWQMGPDAADLKRDDTLLQVCCVWLVDPNDAVDEGRNVRSTREYFFFNIEGDESNSLCLTLSRVEGNGVFL